MKPVFVALGIVMAVLAATAVLASRQPDEFAVSRTRIISAPPGAVYPLINDLRDWSRWSPWADLDPSARVTFEGPPAGAGAVMQWAGNHKVGEGSMTIVESRPDEYVGFRLDFVKPFESTSSADFTLTPVQDGTSVTWRMIGRNNFLGKIISLFMDCEKMIDEQFQKGLSRLDVAVRSRAP